MERESEERNTKDDGWESERRKLKCEIKGIKKLG